VVDLICVLLQFYANLYGIPVPAGKPDPDIFITLEVLGGSTNVGLYCNPGWGQYADVNANYPQPGYAVWQSDLSNDVDTVFISKNDRLYRPPYAREPNTTAYASYQPYFICSVRALGSNFPLRASCTITRMLIILRGAGVMKTSVCLQDPWPLRSGGCNSSGHDACREQELQGQRI
jgi:hypothetical protein